MGQDVHWNFLVNISLACWTLLLCSFGYVNNEGVNDVYKISEKFMTSQVVQDTFFQKGGYGRLGCQCERHTRTLLLAVLDQVR